MRIAEQIKEKAQYLLHASSSSFVHCPLLFRLFHVPFFGFFRGFLVFFVQSDADESEENESRNEESGDTSCKVWEVSL